MITITVQKRRQLLLASCTIAFALLASSFLQTKLNAFDNSSFNANNVTSLERWIDLQRPSHRRDEEGIVSNLAVTELLPGVDDESNNNNNSGNDMSMITATDLTHLSYDSSCLSDEGHRVLGARYLEERRRSAVTVEEELPENQSNRRRLDGENFLRDDELVLTNDNIDGMSQDGPFGDDSSNWQYLRGGSSISDTSSNAVDNKILDGGNKRAAVSSIQKTKMMSPKKMLLRTAASASNQNQHDELKPNANNHNHDEASTHRDLIDDYDEEGWTSHRGEIAPPPSNSDAQLLQQHIMEYVNGQHDGQEDINMNTAAAAGDEPHVKEEEETSDELYLRMQQVMKVTQSLHRQFGGTPPPSTTTDNDNTTDTMVQYSHTSQHSRQRLLTGSYATWQWYDRSNLASPVNLNLNKVSRVNYAFFQSDTDGYIFGTDSWADPNVLNGPYDFSIGRDELPSYCQGGRGRDDGKNIQQDGGLNQIPGRTRRRRRTQLSFGDVNDDLPPCEHFERCHRNFPDSKVCNVHKYKEGLIYLSHQAGAEIYPSIGGWTLSGSFPTVAADVDKRRRFAKECVGLIQDYGFDGIDIDWEYPGYRPHGGSDRDRENFNRLLLEIREALNDYQMRTGDAPLNGGAFGLTAALPCGPTNIKFLDISYLGQVLDGMNLMTFDFHSEKEGLVGANAPLYDQEWDIVKGLSVDGCVRNYVEGGAGEHSYKISIGIPFYGSTYSFATELGGFHSGTGGKRGGMVDQANWPQDLGTPVYYNILEKFGVGRGLITRRHEPTKTQYAYFEDGSGLVSYDDPQSVCDKVDFANQNFLAGVFVWELSGDITASLETPLLDMVNRKMEEITFDCRLVATPEDGSVIELPPEKPKGPAQYEVGGTDVDGVPIKNVVDAIFDHIQRAENGELESAGAGYGHFSRNILRHRTYDGSTFPSYNYRYDNFIDALRRLTTEGIDRTFFYLGKNQNGKDDGDESVTTFENAEDLKKPLQDSIVYGLVNIAAFLAQAMVDSIIHDSCDELNVEYLPDDKTDGIGLDDGNDQYRFPLSNACGQNGRSYQDEACPNRRDKNLYDCATQLNSEQILQMEAHAVSRGLWKGAPKAFFCGPTKSVGFWDAMVGVEERDVDIPNEYGRTDLEGCCWWGRGSLKIRGTCLYGKLNHFIGKKAATDGRSAWFPDIDLCLEPGQVCAGPESPALRWITGMYHWMENIQSYSEEDGNYKEQLFAYVNGDLHDEQFFYFLTKLYVLNCAGTSCNDRTVPDMDDRLRAFETVLNIFNIQFGSHATAAPPFVVFPGQVSPAKPTPAPTSIGTEVGLPATVETVDRQVKVYLTGVEPDRNMTNEEQLIFENLMFDLLVPRLATVDIGIVEAIIDSQNPYPEFEPVASQAPLGFGEEKPAVLEILMNVTLTFSEYPSGWRDWSIYVKSWIESFGNTMVEIFTSPKHPQHPATKSKFWDGLEDVSAVNVPLPNTDPTYQPTIAPTYIIYPEPPASNLYYMLGGVFAGLGAVCFCIGFFTYKFREHKRLMEEAKQKRLRMLEELEKEYAPPKATFNALLSSFKSSIREQTATDDDDASGSSSSSGSDSSSESSSDSDLSIDNGEMPASEEEESNAPSFDEEPSAAQSYVISEAASQTTASSNQASEYDEISESQSRDVSRAYESRASSYLPSSYASSAKSRDQSYFSEDGSMPSQVSISDDDYDHLVERVLENDPNLKEIVLDNKKDIGYDGGEALWEALAHNSNVEKLSVKNSNIRDEEVEALSLALIDNTSITHLWLGDNAITSEGAEFLIGALESNETIVMLNLFGNAGIDADIHEEMKEILESRGGEYHSGKSEALSVAGGLIQRVQDNDPTLINLDLRKMEFGLRNDVFTLFDALAENTHIQRVDLSLNELDDECVESLSLALVDNRSIRYLNLAVNAITSEGAEFLIGTLDSNDVLREIELEGNAIDDDILDDIYDILDERPQLSTAASVSQAASVSHSSIGEMSLAEIVDRLFSDDPKLVELSLDGMNLADGSEFDSLVDALTTNEMVTKLSLNHTGMNDDNLASLSMALSENNTITYISLRDNQITDEGCEYLLGCLDTNETIEFIDLSGNQVGDNLIEEVNACLAPRLSSSVAESIGTSVSGRSSAYARSHATGRSGMTSASGRSRASRSRATSASYRSGATSASGASRSRATSASYRSGATSASGASRSRATSASYRSGATSASGRSGVTSASGRSGVTSASGRSGVTTESGRSGASSRSPASGRSAETSISLIIDRIKSNDPNLVNLKLNGTNLAGHDERESMIDALGGNDVIKTLNFDDTGIDDDVVAALSLALAENKTITHISLRDNQITNEGCEYLLGTLDQNTTLSRIDLSGNQVDDDLMNEIDAINQARGEQVAVEGKPPMHEVPEESDLVVRKRKAIMKVMKDASIPWPEKNKRILELQKQYYVPQDANEEDSVSHQDGDEDINVLVERVINDDKNLQEIILDDQKVSVDTLLDMIDALAGNSCVKYLSLRNMKIGNDVAEKIADILKENATLVEINLEDNQVTSNGAKKFVDVLRDHNDTLQYLELADNQVRSGLISQLKKMLEDRQSKYTEEIEQSESDDDSASRQSSASGDNSSEQSDDDSSRQSSAQSSAYSDEESMSSQSSAAKSKSTARSSRHSSRPTEDDDGSRSKQSTLGSRSRRSERSRYSERSRISERSRYSSAHSSNDDGSRSKQSRSTARSRYSRQSEDASRSRYSSSRNDTDDDDSRRQSTIGSRSRRSGRSANSSAYNTEDGSRSRRSGRSNATSEQSSRQSSKNNDDESMSNKKKSVMSRFKLGKK